MPAIVDVLIREVAEADWIDLTGAGRFFELMGG